MIFLDSNVPMYLIGAEHPNKAAAVRWLEAAVAMDERLVTSAEVLQEILHRYVAIGRREAIDPAFGLLLGVVDEVYPVTREDALRARKMLAEAPRLSARDAVHVAVMERRGIERIMTFDTGFDDWPAVRREPA
jgi:predicted nucleic acid-binding protein